MSERAGSVIITGASGRIGAELARRLGGRYRVVAFDRPGPPHPPPGVETIEVDFTSDESVRSGLSRYRQGHGIDVASVLHLAAYYDFTGEPSPRYDEINVAGSARLLRGLGEAGLAVEQFAYASTMVVHAPGSPGRPISEGSPLGPTIPYARSKLRAEGILREGRGEIPLVILRLANVYDDLVHHPVLAQQFRRVYERRFGAGIYPGDASHGQSYLHLDDLIDAFGRVIDRRRSLPPAQTLLLGEPGAVSYADIQRGLGRLLHGEPWPTRRVPKALARAGLRLLGMLPGSGEEFLRPWMIDRAGDHYELDVCLARESLGWSPRRTLLGSLPGLAEALLHDPEGWYRSNGLDGPRSPQPPRNAATTKTTPR